MQNVNYTEYDLNTGKILRNVSSSSKKIPSLRKGVGRIMAPSSPQRQIVVNGEIVPKHVFFVDAIRNGSSITLSNVPEGVIITAENEQFTMDDSNIFELEIDQPVDVTFTLTHDLYETKVIHVES